ncbi:MAG: hypothetical protein M3O15_15725 [Acidobacteriota bacterium]|nr:hypothetical protein [Acidobacteriota bacterium]
MNPTTGTDSQNAPQEIVVKNPNEGTCPTCISGQDPLLPSTGTLFGAILNDEL